MSARAGKKAGNRQHLKAILGGLVSLLALWWVISWVSLEELLLIFKEVDYSFLVLAMIVTLLSYVVRSLRWPVLFRHNPPNFNDSFRCLILGFFMNNILPARMGELVRAHLGGRATSQSRSYVLATIAAERLADGLMISLLFAVLFGLDSHYRATGQGSALLWVAFLFFLAGIGTAVVLFFRHRIFGMLESLGRIMPGHLSQYTLVRVKRFIEGLEPLMKPALVLKIVLWSLLVWGIELSAYFFVCKAFSYELSIGGLALFLAAVNFSSLVPAAPGAVGVIEAFATLALEQIGVPRATALAMVIAQHMIQILVVGIPGAIFFFRSLKGRVPDTGEDTDLDREAVAADNFTDVSEPRPQAQAEAVETAGMSLPKKAGNDKDLLLSIVIPAYNEEDRLPKTLLSVMKYLQARGDSFEVLVVDDGSTDNTASVVSQFEHLAGDVRLISYERNRGKGYAVRFGVLNSVGRFILYNDADGASPIEEIERLEEAIQSGSDIAIGSRAMFSQKTNVSTVWYRKIIGRVFNGFVNFLVLPGIADTQCGFKLFTHDTAKDLFSRQHAERFSFDVEILFLARKAGYKIAEVPINWTNVPGSKVNLVKDSIAMGIDILKFRLRDLFGGYSNPRPL